MSKTITKNANNIMWVEYWIQQAHPSFKDYELYAEKYDEYRWICEIKLPLIDKTVTAISQKEIQAILNASNKAAKLIDEYMKLHPELHIDNPYKNGHWEIKGNEDGEYESRGLSSKERRRQGSKYIESVNKSMEIVSDAIDKIKKILGDNKGFSIHVYDLSCFPADATINEISSMTNDMLVKELGEKSFKLTSIVKDDHVIAIVFINTDGEWEEESYQA